MMMVKETAIAVFLDRFLLCPKRRAKLINRKKVVKRNPPKKPIAVETMMMAQAW
jgi:hypothetical protein